MAAQESSRHVVLGVCASVAIHRALDLTSELKKEGHVVSVIMTPNAKRLVSPVQFQALSLSKVFHEMWEVVDNADHDHIRLAQSGDVFVVAPATAGTIGKLAHGILDNIVVTTAFAMDTPKLFAPAMNWRMWADPIIQENSRRLEAHGWLRIGPADGDLACGERGAGRLSPVAEILQAVRSALRG